MSAGRYNLQIDQGETFVQAFRWEDPVGVLVNLTGYTGSMQIRAGDDDALVLDVDDLAGGVILGGAAGTVTVTIPPASTLALPEATVLTYDLKVTSGGGQVAYIAAGTVYVRKQVSA